LAKEPGFPNYKSRTPCIEWFERLGKTTLIKIILGKLEAANRKVL